MKSFRAWLALACGLALQHGGAQTPQSATVHLTVETQIGDPVKDAHITFLRLGTNKDFGLAFRKTTGTGIPFGEYELTVFAPGFKKYVRRLSIFEPETTFRVAMKVSIESTGEEVVEGVVVGSPRPPHSRWVLFFPLSGSPDDVLEVPVEEDGRFTVRSTGGSYLMAVIDRDKLLSSRQVFLGHNIPALRIILGKDPL